MSKNSIDIKINNWPTDQALEQLVASPMLLDSKQGLFEAVAAAADVVVKRARELTPRSKKSDTDRRSAKQKAAANWDYPLWKSIDRVNREYRRGRTIAVVGPRWPEGNKVYVFTSSNGRRVFYWGKNANKTKAAVRNWIVQAFDETRDEQLAAMKGKLQQAIDKVMRAF